MTPEGLARGAGFFLILLLLTVGLGCGSSTKQQQQPTQSSAKQTARPDSKPLACLKEAGLINVQRRTKGVWIGDNESPFFGVLVQSFATRAAATRFAAGQKSVNNWVGQAGRFVVGGPGKADVPDDHGDIAAVASCLRR